MAQGVATSVECDDVVRALGRGSSVLITGEDDAAGTRLLVAVAARATTDGWTVVPLRAAGRDVPLSALDGLAPHAAGAGILDHVVEVIEVIRTRGDKVVVLVDDAALLDAVSAAVLRHLADEPHVCVVLATRRSERLADVLRPVPTTTVDLRASRAARRARDAATKRLASLEDDERRAVELLTAADGPVGAAIIADLAGSDVMRLLEQDDVIIGDRTDRRIDLRLVRRLHAEVVADAMGEATRRERQVSLADAIASLAGRREDALRIALLRGAAQDPSAVDELLDAALGLLSTHRDAAIRPMVIPPVVADGFAEASARLARIALGCGGRQVALEVLVRSLERLGRGEEARALIDDADRYVVDAQDEVLAAGLQARRSAKDGLDQRATAALADELTDASGDRRAQILSARLDVLMLGGRTREAIADGDELLAAGPLPPRVAAPYGLALAQGGRPLDALAQVDPILDRRGEVEHDAIGLAALARVAALADLGRLDQAARLAELIVGIADTTDEVGFQATSRLGAAMVALQSGRVAHAAELADSAVQRFDAGDTFGLSGGALGVAASAHAQNRDLVSARARLRAAESTNAEPRALRYVVAHGQAWWLLVEGHRDRAVRELVALAAHLQGTGGTSNEVLVLQDLVRVGEPAAAVGRLELLAATAQGPYARLAADHALALLASDGRALDAVAARAVEHGTLLVAADAAAQAAQAHDQRGAFVEAAASRVLSDELVARCGGPFTPQTARF